MEAIVKPHLDEGESTHQVAFGGLRAAHFIKEVAAGRPVDNRRYAFDEEFIMELHDRVFMAPGIRGGLRQTDSSKVGGKPVMGSYEELKYKMPVFARWFHEQMDLLKTHSEDLILGLEVAAGAHYGLTMRKFHPFDGGNGRTARALMNTVLMAQTYELIAYGLAVPPIPIIRLNKEEGHYVKALRSVEETGYLNPFMTFIAQKWIEFLDGRLQKIDERVRSPKTSGDVLLIDKLKKRRESLQEFVHSGVSIDQEPPKNNGHKNGNYKLFPIPNYFETRLVKFTNAENL